MIERCSFFGDALEWRITEENIRLDVGGKRECRQSQDDPHSFGPINSRV